MKDIFSPSGTSTSLGLVGSLFFLVALLSFTRAVQRLFEQTWELKPLSVRNSLNGLLWVGRPDAVHGPRPGCCTGGWDGASSTSPRR